MSRQIRGWWRVVESIYISAPRAAVAEMAERLSCSVVDEGKVLALIGMGPFRGDYATPSVMPGFMRA